MPFLSKRELMPLSFYILALITIVSAVCAVSLRNLVHCALCLALAFLGVAGLFLYLSAGFVAFAQILVYVGAVAILIVFAILLTRDAGELETKTAFHPAISIPLAFVTGAILLNAAAGTVLPVAGKSATAPAVQQLGTALMTAQVIPLELIGVLLTVALLGAVLTALPENSQSAASGTAAAAAKQESPA